MVLFLASFELFVDFAVVVLTLWEVTKMAYRLKCQTAEWEDWRVERTAGSATLRYVRKKKCI